MLQPIAPGITASVKDGRKKLITDPNIKNIRKAPRAVKKPVKNILKIIIPPDNKRLDRMLRAPVSLGVRRKII
ncbi:MAG: hypothetical protein KG012_15930 [Deltaproteobacteria bacterium]|nr:hypothetical protein [Deltaproteobacteria bacterium]